MTESGKCLKTVPYQLPGVAPGICLIFASNYDASDLKTFDACLDTLADVSRAALKPAVRH